MFLISFIGLALKCISTKIKLFGTFRTFLLVTSWSCNGVRVFGLGIGVLAIPSKIGQSYIISFWGEAGGKKNVLVEFCNL